MIYMTPDIFPDIFPFKDLTTLCSQSFISSVLLQFMCKSMLAALYSEGKRDTECSKLSDVRAILSA